MPRSWLPWPIRPCAGGSPILGRKSRRAINRRRRRSPPCKNPKSRSGGRSSRQLASSRSDPSNLPQISKTTGRRAKLLACMIFSVGCRSSNTSGHRSPFNLKKLKITCATLSCVARRLETINIETGRTPGARFARVLPGRAEHARCIENEKAHLAVRCGLQAMPFAITKPDQIAFAHRRALIVRPRGPTAAQEINERLRALMAVAPRLRARRIDHHLNPDRCGLGRLRGDEGNPLASIVLALQNR